MPARVQGQRLGFTYLRLDDAPEDNATIARYDEVMEALRGQEDLLAEELGPVAKVNTNNSGKLNVGFDFLALPSAGEALTTRVTALLPEDWQREVCVLRLSDGFAVGFLDAAGRRHGLQARGLEADFQPFVQGRRFGFSYLHLDDAPEDPATITRYREVLEVFRGKEDLLERDLRTAPSSSVS